MTFNFVALDPRGLPVSSVLPGLEFLRALPGSVLEAAGEHGPYFVVADRPLPANDAAAPDEELAALRLLDALQEHTPAPLLVPDLCQITGGDVREWALVRRILDGETAEDPGLERSLPNSSSRRPSPLLARTPSFARRRWPSASAARTSCWAVKCCTSPPRTSLRTPTVRRD